MSVVDAADISLFVPVDAVFPGTAATEAAVAAELATVPRDAALMWCARINTIVSGFGEADEIKRQQDVVAMLCKPQEIAALNRFVADHGGGGRVKVFFRGQMLELARQVATHGAEPLDDPDPASNPIVRDRLFKSALIASTLWEQRLFGKSGIPQGDDPTAQRRRFLGAFRRNVEEVNRAPNPGAIIARAWYLFMEYLPQRLPQFAACFEAATDLTLKQYFVCAWALLSRTFANAVPFLPTQYIREGTSYSDTFARFVRLQSQTPEEWAQSFSGRSLPGHQMLRRRPLWRLPGGRSVISDPTFFLENLAPAPLFHVVASRPPGLSLNEIFGAFGLAFEDYATALLKRRFPAGSGILAPQLRCGCKGQGKRGEVFEIDALLNEVTAAVVFEIKAAWLREESIVSADPEEFLAEVRRKYGYDGSTGERPKGVAQLARSVGALARREWPGPENECVAIKELYPVLMVYDARMAAPGSGRFLEDEFRALLGPIPPGVRVHPLIIMTVDNLEHLVFSIEALSLHQVLQAYSGKDPERMSSLHNFMAYSSLRSQVRESPVLADIEETLKRVAREELFPNSAL